MVADGLRLFPIRFGPETSANPQDRGGPMIPSDFFGSSAPANLQ
jgi:hypothetical protein